MLVNPSMQSHTAKKYCNCHPKFGFLQTDIFLFNLQAIPSQVLAPNERFKGMSVDLDETESDNEEDEDKDDNKENDEDKNENDIEGSN